MSLGLSCLFNKLVAVIVVLIWKIGGLNFLYYFLRLGVRILLFQIGRSAEGGAEMVNV